MGFLTRKQGRAGTIRAMARFPEHEREQGMGMLQAAEETFVELGAMSRLGTALFTACAGATGLDGDPAFGVAGGAALMGYSCRMAMPAVDIPSDLSDAVEAQLALTESGGVDYVYLSEHAEQIGKILERTVALADDTATIARLAAATPGGWQAFATTATFQLHRNLAANGLPRRALPSGETIENLLRLGYAIRVVDEIAGERPAFKNEITLDGESHEVGVVGERQDGPVPAEQLDVDRWLDDAATVSASEFEPYAERILELLALDRLEIISFMDYLLAGERPRGEIGDSVITAISNARVGYAMRNRETQLLGRTEFIAEDDPLAALLDERLGGESAIGMAVIYGVLRDVLVFQLRGGRGALNTLTPGAAPELRQQAIQRWADEHYPGDDPHVGNDVTTDLIEHGYYLHRLFEICPAAFEEWS